MCRAWQTPWEIASQSSHVDAAQQSLRAALDWSYQLLSVEDQAALKCLSVFSGGFTLEDAAFVMGPSTDFGKANDRLTSLDGQATLRMLQVTELKRAMGLTHLKDEHGDGVQFALNQGTRRDKVKVLGNGVCAPVMRAVVGSLLGAGSRDVLDEELIPTRLRSPLKGAMNLDEAQRRLGIGQKPMAALLARGTLVPALRGGSRRHDYVFRAEDVEEFLAKLAHGSRKATVTPKDLIAITDLGRGKATTIAECVRKILDGHLKVRARVTGRTGLQALFIDHDELIRAAAGAELTFAAAAIRMRLNARGLRRAIDGGLIEGVPPGSIAVPSSAADRFAERFMMLSEIRDRLGGYLVNLRRQLARAGFDPDPDIGKCLCAGYLRSKIEPLIRRIEAGESLGKPEGSYKALIFRAQKILTTVKAPLPSDDLIAKLRRKMTIGPSDQANFFYRAMWDARETFVHIEGAGWWLRARPYAPYLGRKIPLGVPAPTQTDMVDGAVLAILGSADRPLSKEAIQAKLKAQSIAIPTANGEVFLRRFAVRHAGEVIKLSGLGYWKRARPYAPALYDPTIWTDMVQTALQRAGLWIIKLLNETGRPLTRAQLESVLRNRGIIPGKCSRAYIGNAVAEFAGEIVYLGRVGYWLKQKPWPAAGYRASAGCSGRPGGGLAARSYPRALFPAGAVRRGFFAGGQRPGLGGGRHQ